MCNSEDTTFPKFLIRYTENDDYNRALYHNRSEDTDSKITQVLKDTVMMITTCGSRHDEFREAQLLIRVIEEQADKGFNGRANTKI